MKTIITCKRSEMETNININTSQRKRALNTSHVKETLNTSHSMRALM